MTEPWQIHVCPVHGPRTPTMLGDCPVGCCDGGDGGGAGGPRHARRRLGSYRARQGVRGRVRGDPRRRVQEGRQQGLRRVHVGVLRSGWIACRERHAGAVEELQRIAVACDNGSKPEPTSWSSSGAWLALSSTVAGGSPPRKRRSNSPAAGRHSRRLRPGSSGASTRSARNPIRALLLTILKR
jgi:hypothetical protein